MDCESVTGSFAVEAEPRPDPGAMAVAALACMPDAAALVDPQGNVIACNDAYRRFHRADPDDDCCGPLADHALRWELRTDAEAAPLPLASWPAMRALEGVSASELALQLRSRSTGESWNGAFSFAPVTDHAGQLLGAIVTIRATRPEPPGEQRLKAALEANQIGVWDWDIGRHTIAHSDHLVRMLGYPHAELSNEAAWAALVHPDDLPRVLAALRDHLAGRQRSYEVETRMRAKDGAWRWVHARGQITAWDSHGRALRMEGVHLDITERKSIETARAASEARLRAVVENIPVGIILADEHGWPLFTNDAFRRILHLDDAEGLTLDWMAFMAPADREDMIRQQVALVAGQVDTMHQEFHYHRPGHEPQRVSARIIRVRASHADFTFVGVGQDVTLERTQEEEHERLLRHLQQAQKMEAIGQLAGGIAHDFNNLLTAVVGFSELALNRFVDDPNGKLATYLRNINAAGARGRELVAKMLAFSRREAPESLQAADPLAVAREVATMLGEILPSSMRLSVAEGATVPLARVDALDLHQALVNLVVNARDAVDHHGSITLCVEGELHTTGHCASCHAPLDGHRYVAVSVADDGTGMAPEVLRRIFEPFFTTKEVGRGTGMGLSVVHGVTHQNGGHVQVESTPGRGTVFRLLLPVDTSTADAAEPAGSSPSGVATAADDFTGLEVLVVDDEPSLRDFVKEVLSGAGATITCARDGREALALLREGSPVYDAVFTDQTMPGMTGTELLISMRAAQIATPAVLCSGYGDAVSRQVVAESQATFLAKPAAPDDILVAVARALGR